MQNFPNESTAISNLQKYLRQVAYSDSSMPMVAIDGIFGPDTKNALLAFQRKYGLDATGRADLLTWNLLYNVFSQSLEDNSPPNAIHPFPRLPNDYSVGLCTDESRRKYFLTTIIQIMLIELSVLYDGILKTGITENNYPSGIYDKTTEYAVKEFQKINGLEENGRVCKKTWNLLSDTYNKYILSGNQ